MLRSIYLKNFKCFNEISLPLGNLTLLSGMNSTGKSTVLQALVLLAQTSIENQWSKSISLNGHMLSLGNAGDVINEITGRNSCKIGFSLDSEDIITWETEVENKDSLELPIKRIHLINGKTGEISERSFTTEPDTRKSELTNYLQYLFPVTGYMNMDVLNRNFLTKTTYISAERLGPRETYALNLNYYHKHVGVHGEFTPWYLYEFQDKSVNSKVCINDAPQQLLRQVEGWMSDFFPGCGIKVEQVTGTNIVVLRIRTSQSGKYYRPQNVGYGLTHVLPILAACLSSSKDDLILIENPEAHLHPAGQSKMGTFLSLIADTGAQLIVETHSDHVINGVRKAVRDGKLNHEQTAVYYFSLPSETEENSQVISPIMNSSGNLSEWPKGFFDQYEKDLEYLVGWE